MNKKNPALSNKGPEAKVIPISVFVLGSILLRPTDLTATNIVQVLPENIVKALVEPAVLA